MKTGFVLAIMVVFPAIGWGAGDPVVVEQPVGQIADAGSTVTLSVSVSGVLPLQYSWWHQGVEVPGTDQPRLFLRSVTLADSGVYQMRVRNAHGEAWSEAVVVDVREPEVTLKSGTVLFVNRVAPSIVAPVYDRDGQTLLSGPAFFAQLYGGTSTNTLLPVGPAVPFRTGDGAGFWNPAPDSVRFIPSVEPGGTAWVQVRVWEAIAGPTFEAAVSAAGKFGRSEFLEVRTGGGQPPAPPGPLAGLTSFSLLPTAPPTIQVQPLRANLSVGDFAILEVVASGSALKYQWYAADRPIAGATAPMLQLRSVSESDAGTYYLVVSNGAGSVRSLPMKVTVTVDRFVEFREALSIMEGARGNIRLWIHGDRVVSRAKLWVRFDPNALSDVRVHWSSSLTNASVSANLQAPGVLGLTFAFPYGARPGGETLEVADLDFRARSIDATTVTPLGIQIETLQGVVAEDLRVGTAARSGFLRLEPNPMQGDVNGNGRLDVGDAAVLLRWATQAGEAKPWDVRDNDLDGNGLLDSRDAGKVLAAALSAENSGGQPGASSSASLDDRDLTETPRLWIDPWISPTVAAAGSDLRLTIRVEGAFQGVRGIQLKIQYPPEAIRLSASEPIAPGACPPVPPNFLWATQPADLNSVQDGVVRLAYAAGTNTSFGSSCELAVLNFKVQPGLPGAREFEIKVEAQEATLNGYDLEAVRAGSFGFTSLGSSPSDPNAKRPSLGTPRRRMEGGWGIPVLGDPGRRYLILQSSNLVGWSSGGQVTISSNGEAEVVDASQTNRVRIFRLVETQ